MLQCAFLDSSSWPRTGPTNAVGVKVGRIRRRVLLAPFERRGDSELLTKGDHMCLPRRVVGGTIDIAKTKATIKS